MQPVKRARNAGENYTSQSKAGKVEMPTPLTTIGLDQDTRKSLIRTFNIMAKSDFWHDFGSALMQDLLNSTSLTSSLSFAERGKSILEIRQSIKTKLSVQDYFMEYIDAILPGSDKGERGTYRTEKKLIQEIKVDFDTIEGQLKKWNLEDKSLKELPVIKDITPTFGGYSREYSIRAVPVKAYNDNVNLPSVFKEQTGVHNFILMIDASHLTLTELGLRKKIGVEELLDVVGAFNPNDVYNFYIVQSNENDSDPATKITEVKIEEDLHDKINVYFLKDEGNVSMYPIFLGSATDEGVNENLYSKIGIQTTRVQNNTITATLTGEVESILEDLGEISKIDKASQKAIDSLVETKGVVTPECLSYFLLKRAGDWCQALCLLDRTRVYTLYKQEAVTETFTKILKSGKSKTTKTTSNKHIMKGKVTLQDLIDIHKQQIVVALVTFDRVLLIFALLLGLNVFLTTKYLNLNQKRIGETRSIHWSLFFQNKLSVTLNKEEKEHIVLGGKRIEEDKFDNVDATVKTIEEILSSLTGKITLLFEEIKKATSLDEYLTKLHLLSFLLTSLITQSELETVVSNLSDIIKKIVERNKTPPTSDSEYMSMRDELTNFNTILDKLKFIYNQNGSLLSMETYPEEAHHREILSGILERVQNTKTSTDLRKHISYNNFLEETLKSLREKFKAILAKGGMTLAEIQSLKLEKEYTLKFVVPDATKEASRSQTLLLKYIRDAVLTGFPTLMMGGFRYTPGQDLAAFKQLIVKCFFGLRNRRILALNLYKYNKLTYEYVEDASQKDIFIGLKQTYITDRNGNHFSILDNYLVTNEEEKYFFDIENDDKEVEAESDTEIKKHIAELEKEEKNPYLLMYRYIVMRQRLHLCDTYYSRYRELLNNYEEEMRTEIEANPGNLNDIQANEIILLSDEFQKNMRTLGKDIANLQEEIKEDKLLSLKTPVKGPITFGEYFTNFYYSLSDIRLIIFSYSRRYYTPVEELVFRDFEAAATLASLRLAKEEKPIIDEILKSESTMDSEIESSLEKVLDATSIKDDAIEKSIKGTFQEKISDISIAHIDKNNQILGENTIVDIENQTQIYNTKLEMLASIAAESVKTGGGGRRKTRKSKKRISKRKSRKQ